MKKSKSGFLNGAVTLIICSMFAKIVSAIYKIPLLKSLQTDGLGKYQMVISVYALFLVISSSGMVVTLSKLISREIVYKNIHNQKRYLLAGILISIIISSFLALVLMLISPILSSYQSFSGMKSCFIVIAPSIIFSSLIAVFRGYFLGKRKMFYSGIAPIIESIFKLFLSLYLSIKFAIHGSMGAVFGAILGITLSELISLIILCLIFFVTQKRYKNSHHKIIACLKIKINKIENFDKKLANKTNLYKKSSNFSLKTANFFNFLQTNKSLNFKIISSKSRYKSLLDAAKEIVSISFFVTLQACILPFIGAIDGLVVVPLLIRAGLSQSVAYSLFGIEDGVVSAILSMPTIIASSISSAIIPNIKTQKDYLSIIKNGFKIVWLASISCAALFIFFSNDVTKFLYGSGLNSKAIDEILISADMLRINGFNIIYISLLTLSSGILQGLDRSRLPVKNLFIATILRFIVLLVCLSSSVLNIYGLAIADMSFYACAMILNLKMIKEITNISYNLNQMFVLPICSLFAMLLSIALIKKLLFGILTFRVTILCSMVCGGILYLTLLYLTRVLDYKDIVAFKRKRNV